MDYNGAWLLNKELVISLIQASNGGEPFLRQHWASWNFSTL